MDFSDARALSRKEKSLIAFEPSEKDALIGSVHIRNNATKQCVNVICRGRMITGPYSCAVVFVESGAGLMVWGLESFFMNHTQVD